MNKMGTNCRRETHLQDQCNASGAPTGPGFPTGVSITSETTIFLRQSQAKFFNVEPKMPDPNGHENARRPCLTVLIREHKGRHT